jgi:hypothetical protein
MSDDIMAAYERARELVGEAVWMKLSKNTQANALLEELREFNAERALATVESFPDTRPVR